MIQKILISIALESTVHNFVLPSAVLTRCNTETSECPHRLYYGCCYTQWKATSIEGQFPHEESIMDDLQRDPECNGAVRAYLPTYVCVVYGAPRIASLRNTLLGVMEERGNVPVREYCLYKIANTD